MLKQCRVETLGVGTLLGNQLYAGKTGAWKATRWYNNYITSKNAFLRLISRGLKLLWKEMNIKD